MSALHHGFTGVPSAPTIVEGCVIAIDARKPLVLRVVDLVHQPGSMRTVDLTVPAPADLRNGVIGVPEGSEIELHLRLESVIEGILVTGEAAAVASGECVRCLDPVEPDVETSLQELFAYERDEHADDDEQLLVESDAIDLEPVLRDGLVTALPFQPVCRDDCPGLCPVCGARLADDPDHHHENVDPRWSALSTWSTEREEN